MAEGGDEESAPECFICTESAPAPRRSACKCTERYVHDACLAKMLETRRHAVCPVCAAPYTNISSRLRVVGVDVCSPGVLVIGAVLMSVVLLVCGVNTWWVYCCSERKLSRMDNFVACFSAILMTSVGMATVAFVGRGCVMQGPRGLARSMLLHKRTVRVGTYNDLPVDVALPPRVGACEFAD